MIENTKLFYEWLDENYIRVDDHYFNERDDENSYRYTIIELVRKYINEEQ